jgi:DNA-directed RNA polymerase specialized sigma24 family protein
MDPSPTTPLAGADPWSRTIDTTATAAAAEVRADDASIVRAVLAGDRDSYRHLVERESAAIIRACHRVLGDLGEAEDIAQEAFVIAYRSLASWRADGPFGAWLSRIAVRLAIRHAGRRKSVPWASPNASTEGGEDPMARLRADWTVDPEGLALRGERHANVRRAVASLTGRPLGTVKTHLHRGLLRLRGSMGEEAR